MGRVRRWLIAAAAAVVLMIALLAPPIVAQAHSLDVFLQASYITVAAEQIVVEIDLTPGVLLAPDLLATIDTNGDEQISDAEADTYVAAVVSHVSLDVDGAPLLLTVTKIDMPAYLTIQAGYGTIRIFTSATPAAIGATTHQIAFVNGYAPTGSAYQVNTFVDDTNAISLGEQHRDDAQQSISVVYAASGTTAATEMTEAQVDTEIAATGHAARLLAYLDAESPTPMALVFALGLAVAFGALHGLTPGHGKTLVAAYLVGSRGTVQHAVALGAIVTFTHTVSVVVIGLVALFASHFIMPTVLVPALQVVSGVLVVVMGGRLVWQRRVALRGRHHVAEDHAHRHHDDAAHAHAHANGLAHDHGDGRVHSHLPPAEGFTFGSLIAMGVSGGLVPCPEALGIMIIAVGLNHVLLGLGMIAGFSIGLATMLIAIGVVLVRSRSLVERAGGFGGRWSRALPLGSAVMVTVLGVGIVLGGLNSYMR